MSEFSSRVEAQRQILRTVNDIPWRTEQLFALNVTAIERWANVNHIDTSTKLVKLLNAASAQIFVMANHSDDPIAGTYLLTKDKVSKAEVEIRTEIRSLKAEQSQETPFENPTPAHPAS